LSEGGGIPLPNPSPFISKMERGKQGVRMYVFSTPSFDYKIHPSRGEYATIKIPVPYEIFD